MGVSADRKTNGPAIACGSIVSASARFPVTNREYKNFCEDTRSIHAAVFCAIPMFSLRNQPVVGVSWDEAAAYCEWLSEKTGRDVSTAERSRVGARGARRARRTRSYPWGNEPPSEKCFIGCDPQTGGPAKVGVNAPNGFGLFDMSENVHEWCADYYDYNYYRYSPERNPRGPSDPDSGARRAAAPGAIASNSAAVPRAALCRRVSNMPITDFASR